MATYRSHIDMAGIACDQLPLTLGSLGGLSYIARDGDVAKKRCCT